MVDMLEFNTKWIIGQDWPLDGIPKGDMRRSMMDNIIYTAGHPLMVSCVMDTYMNEREAWEMEKWFQQTMQLNR